MRSLTSWYVAIGAILAAAALQMPVAFADKQEKDKNVQEVGSCKLVFPSGDETCTIEPKKHTEAKGFSREGKTQKGPGSYVVEISKKKAADPAAAGAPAMPLNVNIECMIPYSLDATKKVAGKCRATFSQKLDLFVRDSMSLADKQPAGTKHADFEFTGTLKVENGSPADTKKFVGPVNAPQTVEPEQDKFVAEETKDTKTLSGFVDAPATMVVNGKVIVSGDLSVTFVAASKEALIRIQVSAAPVVAVLTDVP